MEAGSDQPQSSGKRRPPAEMPPDLPTPPGNYTRHSSKLNNGQDWESVKQLLSGNPKAESSGHQSSFSAGTSPDPGGRISRRFHPHLRTTSGGVHHGLGGHDIAALEKKVDELTRSNENIVATNTKMMNMLQSLLAQGIGGGAGGFRVSENGGSGTSDGAIVQERHDGGSEAGDGQIELRNLQEKPRLNGGSKVHEEVQLTHDDSDRLTPEEEEEFKDVIERVRDVFTSLDEDRSGNLDPEETCRGFEKLGAKIESVDELMKLMKLFDTDCDGEISLDEFQAGYMFLYKRQRKIGAEATSSVMAIENDFVSGQKVKVQPVIVGSSSMAIDPLGLRASIWDFVVTILLLSTLITMPLIIGWDEIADALFYWNLLLDGIFFLDLVKNFFTGFMNEEHQIVMKWDAIFVNYLFGWFTMDLVCCLPIDAIIRWKLLPGVGQGQDTARMAKMLKPIRLVRIAKIVKLIKRAAVFKYIRKAVQDVQDQLKFHPSDGAVRLSMLFLYVLLLGHWMGCLIFLFERMNSFPEMSWSGEEFYGIKHMSIMSQYKISMWKALGMLIMLDDEGTWCFDAIEEWCMYQHYEILLCYYIGAVFNALLLAEMSGIIMSMGMAERAFQDRMRQVEDYMKSKDLSFEIKECVRNFFKVRYGGRIFDEDDLLNELTPALKRNILNYTSTELLNLVPFIRDQMSESMRKQIASCLHTHIYMDGTNVIEEGSTGDAIYFIKSGIVEVWSKYQPNPVNLLTDGAYVGDVAVLLSTEANPIRRTATVKPHGSTVVTTAVMHADDFLAVVEQDVELHEYLTFVAIQRKEKMARFNPMTFDPSKAKDVTRYADDPEDLLSKNLFLELKEAGASGRERVWSDDNLMSRDKKKERADLRAGFMRGARLRLSANDESEIGGLPRRASSMLTASDIARLSKGGATDNDREESPRSDGTQPS